MEFEEILEWLTTHGFNVVAQFLSFIFGLVIMIIQVKKYKLNSRQAKEQKNMKYRTANYRETVESPKQSFDTEVDQYRLNKSTNELEKLPDKLDIQQLVQSAEAQALPNMLQHLEPVVSPEDEVLDLHNDMLDQLDVMREADEYRLYLCSRYQLDNSMSFDQVLAYLKDQEAEQRGKVQALQKIKKGGASNEAEKVGEAKPSDVGEKVS